MSNRDRFEQVALLLSVLGALLVTAGTPLFIAIAGGEQHKQRCAAVAEVSQGMAPQVMALALALVALRRSHGGPRDPPRR